MSTEKARNEDQSFYFVQLIQFVFPKRNKDVTQGRRMYEPTTCVSPMRGNETDWCRLMLIYCCLNRRGNGFCFRFGKKTIVEFGQVGCCLVNNVTGWSVSTDCSVHMAVGYQPVFLVNIWHTVELLCSKTCTDVWWSCYARKPAPTGTNQCSSLGNKIFETETKALPNLTLGKIGQRAKFHSRKLLFVDYSKHKHISKRALLQKSYFVRWQTKFQVASLAITERDRSQTSISWSTETHCET